MDRQRMKKKLFSIILYLLFCLALLFGVSEITCRTILRKKIVLFPRFHTSAKYGDYTIRRLLPNAHFYHQSVDGMWEFKINNQGFRTTHNYIYENTNGAFRVICMGDSHTEGFESDQNKTYSEILNAYLKKNGITGEVLNAGISGFGTAEALVFLENEAYKYRPDVIILGFFANDFDDNLKSDLFRLKTNRLIETSYYHAPAVQILDKINRIPLLRWLSQHSYAYSFAFNTVWNMKKKMLYNEKQNEMMTEYAIKQNDTMDVREKKNELCLALLSRMYEFCREKNIFFIILDIPQLGCNGKAFNSSIPSKLEEMFRTRCDLLICATNILANYNDADDLFVPNGQRHISEKTHWLLGREAGNAIMNHGKEHN